MFLANNSDLEIKLGLLLTEHNLQDIVAYLSDYLEIQSKVAQKNNSKEADILFNASGFCLLLLSELERLPASS